VCHQYKLYNFRQFPGTYRTILGTVLEPYEFELDVRDTNFGTGAFIFILFGECEELPFDECAAFTVEKMIAPGAGFLPFWTSICTDNFSCEFLEGKDKVSAGINAGLSAIAEGGFDYDGEIPTLVSTPFSSNILTVAELDTFTVKKIIAISNLPGYGKDFKFVGSKPFDMTLTGAIVGLELDNTVKCFNIDKDLLPDCTVLLNALKPIRCESLDLFPVPIIDKAIELALSPLAKVSDRLGKQGIGLFRIVR